MKIRNLAHRGFSGKYPENTRLAFVKAIEEAGADGFESDVHLSADGEPVVIHDHDLSRTTNGSGSVGGVKFAELRLLDNGVWKGKEFAGQRILHLDELLEIVAEYKAFLNLEIKTGEIFYKDIEKICIKRINALGLGKQVLISSFNHISVQRCMEIDPSIRTGFLYESPLINMVRYGKQHGASALHPRLCCLYYSPDLADKAHAEGLEINTWTVNTEDDMRYCIRLGVDSIISNYPDKTSALLKNQTTEG
ncbi:MAG: glycerophosphodiester phosphodiesterase [Spirochaetaceae bacterium]|jgi:glycerophosphoryl diester phosphodiesterase|nr:glycerophosphodiester phosphodiesterase [Spirochaetaceae bacterium]